MSVKNIPIIGKILILLGLFGVLSLASAVFSASKMKHIGGGYAAAIDHQGKASVALSQANGALRGVRASLADLELLNSEAGKKRALAALAATKAEFIAAMDRAVSFNPESSAAIEALRVSGLKAIEKTCSYAIDYGHQVTDQAHLIVAQGEFLNTCSPALERLLPKMADAVDKALAAQDEVETEMSRLTMRSIWTTYSVVVVGFLLTCAIAFMAVRKWISRPINVLTDTMKSLASGDVNVAISGSDRKDEIGPMVCAVQVFKDNMIRAERLAAEAEIAARERQAAEQRLAAERAETARQQDYVVRSVAAGLEKLAEGDLVFRLDEAFAAEYEKLRTDFNAAITKLQDTVSVISGSTLAIRSGTAEISAASDDLSRRTEQQAASLEETAAALDEITATVKKTSAGSLQARSVVAQAKADAERSGVVVGQAVEAMGAIEQSSNKVSQIIGVIDEIAFQTNLLALNAGVEAARAGEAGRGFAVVASEVRALAQRSAEAAKEIKALISMSSEQVSRGVGLVSETGTALDRIVSQVAEINAVVSEIANSTQEQATALEEVNTAVNQMDQVTQQNAAMVEESTAASRNLTAETEDLSRLIGQFRTGAEASRGRAASPVRSAPQPVRLAKTSGRSSPALKPQPQEAAWEEF